MLCVVTDGQAMEMLEFTGDQKGSIGFGIKRSAKRGL